MREHRQLAQEERYQSLPHEVLWVFTRYVKLVITRQG